LRKSLTLHVFQDIFRKSLTLHVTSAVKKTKEKCCMTNKGDTGFFNNGAWDGATLKSRFKQTADYKQSPAKIRFIAKRFSTTNGSK
jgi:hypothetical protein